MGERLEWAKWRKMSNIRRLGKKFPFSSLFVVEFSLHKDRTRISVAYIFPDTGLFVITQIMFLSHFAQRWLYFFSIWERNDIYHNHCSVEIYFWLSGHFPIVADDL